MKTLFVLLAGSILSSFINKPADGDLDGYWMGYYRSELTKERVIVKLSSNDQMDFYTGGIDDRTRVQGTYRIYGDSVCFKYSTPEGEQIEMQGHFNYRRNYMDGVCRTNDQPSGSFYLEKQKLEERIVQP